MTAAFATLTAALVWLNIIARTVQAERVWSRVDWAQQGGMLVALAIWVSAGIFLLGWVVLPLWGFGALSFCPTGYPLT
jgi:hypothetical protein